VISKEDEQKRERIKELYFLFLFLLCAVLIILATIEIVFPKVTYYTYEITEFYLLDGENFCTFINNEDGGEEMIVFPIEKTAIYPTNDKRQYAEIKISGEGTPREYIIMIKVYISKTLDEVERIK
jgi:hypothetical protein